MCGFVDFCGMATADKQHSKCRALKRAIPKIGGNTASNRNRQQSKGTKSTDVPPVLMRLEHVARSKLQRKLIFCDASSLCPCLGKKKRSQINDASSDGHEINRCGQEEV